MTRLIGINGRLRSGKDTAFEIIQREHGGTVKRAAFADLLKLSAALAVGYDPTYTKGAVDFCNDLKESGKIHVTWDDPTGHPRGFSITGREYLQRYGTEAHRDVFGSDFWVRTCLGDNWADDYGNPDVLVITDCRFPNEAARIMVLGGEVWCIDAEDRLGPLPEDAHPSEFPLAREFVDFYVPNNGTLAEFEQAVREELDRSWYVA